MNPTSSSRGSIFAIVGWAFFLACSWTWCIGMWLPVLLHRDYGPLAFFAFAVPNCLGAAAMGLALRKPGASDALVRRHLPACLAFSAVTLAFQWFFLTITLVSRDFSSDGLGLVALALMVRGLAAIAFRSRDGASWLFSAGVFSISLAMFVWYLADRGVAPIPPELLSETHPERLPYVAAACVFGFVFCPYLDLTFHRARQRLDAFAAGGAFIVGFCILFPVMILFTRAYAPDVIADSLAKGFNLGPGFLPTAVALHLITQLIFTIAAHDNTLGRLNTDLPVDHNARSPAVPSTVLTTSPVPYAISAFAPLAGILLALLDSLRVPGYGDLSCNETIYRAFMGFYALVFPAYVWLCILPNARRRAAPTRFQFLLFAIGLLVTLPMFAAAFFAHSEYWLAPALAILLLAAIPAWLIPRAAARANTT